ncbi:MAG: response regulator receiver protein [Pedosphaera sp.]|nr:response regulator receiver protein [Pedosphaera sp.]
MDSVHDRRRGINAGLEQLLLGRVAGEVNHVMSAAHVLHVDDDPSDTMLTKQACSKAGVSFQLHSVSDGEMAISYLSGADRYADRDIYPLPRLILLDLKMPRKTGFDVLVWIRSQDSLRYIPVVILTASNQEEDIKRAYELGANSFLVKPVGIHTLIEMVKLVDAYWLGINQSPTLSV